MPQETEQTVQIVMGAVAEERQPDAAMFLSGCFSLPPASTRSIAASGPIALLADLDRRQAEAVVAELRPALPPGVDLAIEPDGTGDVARLQWPRPPRIYGKDIDDYAGSEDLHEVKCPLCGGMLRIVTDASGIRVSSIHDRDRARGDTVFVPHDARDEPALFSDISPLATANADYASLRSLQAGDTGFWMDNQGQIPVEPPVPGGTSNSRRFRSSAGIAAFMKPGAFSVVASRTRDPQVVKMVSEITGLPEAEAREKCLALSLTVARGISLDEAQSLLARLATLSARARIVRPAPA